MYRLGLGGLIYLMIKVSFFKLAQSRDDTSVGARAKINNKNNI